MIMELDQKVDVLDIRTLVNVLFKSVFGSTKISFSKFSTNGNIVTLAWNDFFWYYKSTYIKIPKKLKRNWVLDLSYKYNNGIFYLFIPKVLPPAMRDNKLP
jgi:hypothetical protein